MGSVSETVGVTATNTGAASEKGVGVVTGVGWDVGVVVGSGTTTRVTGKVPTKDGVESSVGDRKTGAVLEAGAGSRVQVSTGVEGGNVGRRVGVMEPDAKLPATDNALNSPQEATIIRPTAIHLPRVIRTSIPDQPSPLSPIQGLFLALSRQRPVHPSR
jgi:hypothetical protein